MKHQLQMLQKIFLLGLVTISVTACSFGKSAKEYVNSESTNPLEAPPDLVTPDWEESLEIPKTANDRVSALEMEGPALGAAVLPEYLEIRVRREGATRWLEVNTDPVTLWPSLREFWKSQGFEISQNEPVLGYIETAWKQNTNQTAAVGGQRESFDITGEKFRTRVERQPNAVSNIYLTQRGAEVAAINQQNQILWKPQPPNSEREAVMMTRLMEYLGTAIEDAQDQFIYANNQSIYIDIQDIGGVPALVVGDGFSRVWRRTGVALDRSGLLIEDHDRAKGLYFVVLDLTPAEVATQNVKLERAAYEIHLLGQGKKTLITAHEMDKSGSKIDVEVARKLLQRIIAAYPGGR